MIITVVMLVLIVFSVIVVFKLMVFRSSSGLRVEEHQQLKNLASVLDDLQIESDDVRSAQYDITGSRDNITLSGQIDGRPVSLLYSHDSYWISSITIVMPCTTLVSFGIFKNPGTYSTTVTLEPYQPESRVFIRTPESKEGKALFHEWIQRPDVCELLGSLFFELEVDVVECNDGTFGWPGKQRMEAEIPFKKADASTFKQLLVTLAKLTGSFEQFINA